MGIVTENVHDPHNIFACMRTCDSVGIQDVHIIQTAMKTKKDGEVKALQVPING